jgi:Fe-S-cluster containining protein
MDDDTEQVSYGRYECDQCGACCKGTFIVEVDYLDARRDPRLLDQQIGSYRVTQRELEEEGKVALLACGHHQPCGCLGEDNRCTIYPTRPNACVDFEAGCQKCQDARAELGIEPLLPLIPTARSQVPPPIDTSSP